jgi:hypothetical protein
LAHKATLRERYRHVLRVRARRRLAPRRPEGMCAQRHDPLAVAKEHYASVSRAYNERHGQHNQAPLGHPITAGINR